MDEELKGFIEWLETDLTHFVALAEEGSVVCEDPWQDGYSDHDIHVIVSQDLKSETNAIYERLTTAPLSDLYLVTPRLLETFLTGDSLNDLSLKFRTKVLAGRDVVDEKQAPNREKATEIGHNGLVGLVPRLERRWLNLAHWSEAYAQSKNYEILKNFFVFFSALHYGQTGDYPKNRQVVADLLNNQELASNMLKVTNNINHASKNDQKIAIESAISLISEYT